MKKIKILFLLLIIIGGIFFFWWNHGLAPVNSSDKSTQYFVVGQGKGVRELANNLKEQGLINDPIVFFLLIRQRGLDNKIQAGDFKLSPSMNANQIADTLTHGTVDIWITIPEGKRAEEIADTLQEKIPSYQESWRDELRTQEGYLFPDTYLIPKDADVATVISILNNNFYTKLNSIGITKNTPNLKSVVIVASLIEREAITDAEKPVIAGIIQNRLSDGMALQIDATIQYAKGKRNGKWWSPVLSSEYQSVKSTYNTYLYPGLPPGPISNPGLESLKAAANPTNTPYYYYLHDKNGVIHYAKTIDEHNANIRKYGL